VLQNDLKAHGITDFGSLLSNTFGSIRSASMALVFNDKVGSEVWGKLRSFV